MFKINIIFLKVSATVRLHIADLWSSNLVEQLQNWIIKNMVIEHFGDFIGLRDINAEQLRELSELVKNAQGLRSVPKPSIKK